MEAPLHKYTFLTDKPKDQVVSRWKKEHPDCTMVMAEQLPDRTVIIEYHKNDELEAARLAKEQMENRG